MLRISVEKFRFARSLRSVPETGVGPHSHSIVPGGFDVTS
jgi:hypothetical protein